MLSAPSHTRQLRSCAMTSLVSGVLHCLVMGLAPLTTLALARASPSTLTPHTLQSHLSSPTQWSQGQQGQGKQGQDHQNQGHQSEGQQSQSQQSQSQLTQGQQSHGSPAVEATTSALSSAPPPTETPSTPSPPCPPIRYHRKEALNGSITWPPTRYHREEAWNGGITWPPPSDVNCRSTETSWTYESPQRKKSAYHFVMEVHFVEMERNDSLEIFSLDDTNKRLRIDYKLPNGTAVSPILVPSNQMLIEVKTTDEDPKFRERRNSRFKLTFTVIVGLISRPAQEVESRFTYQCDGFARLPGAITCDGIRHCEQGEDEESCSYRRQGCGTWFPFSDKCFKFTYKDSFDLSTADAREACRLKGAILATLQEPGAMQTAFTLTRKSGYRLAYVGLKKVRPVSRRLKQLYRFLWRWGQQGGPIAYEQQQLQRDGATLDCAALDVSEKPALRQVSCTGAEHDTAAYICMKPNPTLSTESSAPSSVSLAKATQFPSKFPVKECPDGSYVQLFHRCLWGKERHTQNYEGAWSPNNLPLFKCSYGQAVHYSLLCDGKDDCADGSDELDCRRPQFAPLLNSSFICNNFQAIPAHKRCDGVFDCFDESDEEYCPSCGDSSIKGGLVMCLFGVGCVPRKYSFYFENCVRSAVNIFAHYFSSYLKPALLPYESGDPGQVVLDGFGMSKMDKVEGNCSEGFCPCVDSYCIPTFLVNNGEKDCPRGEDEDVSLTVTCPGYYRCQDLGTCVHATHLCDGIYHCPNKDDEMFCKGLVQNQNCKGPGYYRCHGLGSCVSASNLCNGKYDCPNKDDEIFCHKSLKMVQNRSCEVGPDNYHCYKGACAPVSYICDGIYDCPFSDDEFSCDVICPRAHGCKCEGHAYTCSSMIDPLYNLHVRYLDVSHARNVSLKNIHFMEYLFFLNVSFCGLDNVTLTNMPQLQTLDLSNNLLTQLDSLNLYKFHGLLHLDLSNNPILTTLDNAFSEMLNSGGLHNLQTLIMTGVGLETITSQGFSALSNLVYLDISMNAVHSYTEDSLSGLTALEELYTDETNLCCSYFHATLPRCHAPVDELSSCSDLLGQDFFRVCLWSLSSLALLGNAGVLIYRLFSKQTTALSSQILVKTLCASDLLMGVYMMVIGVADAQFRGVYVAKENEWQSSVACTTLDSYRLCQARFQPLWFVSSR